MEPFKNIYNKKNISFIGDCIQNADRNFDANAFIKSACKNISQLEMKDRMLQIMEALSEALPYTYKKNIHLLLKTIGPDDTTQINGFLTWPYTQYVETYGLEHFDHSMKAIGQLTTVFTGEFAVRKFIDKDSDRAFHFFEKWSVDTNEHLRRLASEGTRPFLPWGQNLKTIDKNKKRNIMLLEVLKEDPSLYVRKSVANHLNDFSRLDTALLIKTCKKWSKSTNQHTQWIVKHGLRNLVKQGDPQALKILGYNPESPVKVTQMSLDKKNISQGDTLTLDLTLSNPSLKPQSIIIDYSISYPKKNGSYSDKVFKLKTFEISAKSIVKVKKKIPFRKVTTRTHYPGTHKLSVQVNGVKKKTQQFTLKV